MTKLKKFTAMLLAFCMVVSVVPLQASANPAEVSAGEEDTELPDGSNEVSEEGQAPDVDGEERESEEAEEETQEEPKLKAALETYLIANNEYGIPDEALYKGILTALGKEEDEQFSADEAAAITELKLQNAGIKSLQGIGNLHNLEYLDVSDNELTDFDGLGWMWELKTLVASNNKITDATVLSTAYYLEVLDVSNNKLKNLENINNNNLKELNACNNELTYLADNEFWNIEKFDISNNKVTKLPNFQWTESLSPEFENGKPVVNVSYNRLSKVEIMRKMPEQLTDNDNWVAYNLQGQDAETHNIIRNDATGIPDSVLYANILEAADYDKNGVLTEDEADYLEELYVGWTEKLQENYQVRDLTGIHYLRNLRHLSIERLETTDLAPLLKLEWLESLTIYNSDIKNLDTIKLLKLTSLHMNTVNFADISLKGLEEMTSLVRFEGTIRPEDMQYIVKSKSIDHLDLYVEAKKGNNVLSLEGISGMESLTFLSIYGHSDYEWNDYKDEDGNWQHTQIEYKAKLTDLGELVGCNTLYDIYIQEVEVSAEADLSVFGKLPELKYLTLGNANIEDITALGNLKDMWELRLYGNKISDISVLSCLLNSPDFSSLNLDGNQISDISVLSKLGALSSMSYLSLSNNKIKDISPLKVLESYEGLRYLYLDGNELSNISILSVLKKCSQLYVLDLSDNKIVDISVLTALEGNEEFYELNLSHNQIKELTSLAVLKNCSEFRHLYITENGLKNLTGIEGLANLTRLNAAYNELETLPDLTALVKLDHRYTHFYGNNLTAEELTAKMPEHLAKNQVWVNENRDDEYEWEEIIIDDYDEEDILDAIYDWDYSTVTVVMEEPEKVSPSIFEAAAETGKTVSFDVKNDKGETAYQWSFDGNKINNSDIEIDLSVSFATEKEEEIKALTGQDDAMYLSFAHHGELPGPATMTVYVGDKYDDDEIVYLYYYNEEKKEIELIQGGLWVTNGYVTFTITHCSEYFLLDEELEEDGGSGNGGNGGTEPGTKPGEGSGNGAGGNNGTDNEDKTGTKKPVYELPMKERIDKSSVIAALNDSANSGIKVTLSAPDKITPDVFRALKTSGKTAVFAVMEDGKIVYQWFFDGKEMKDTELTIDMSIAFESQNKAAIDKLTGNKTSVYLSFAHHGKLPGQARITVYVGDTFKDGEVLYPYHYNEKTGELEEVAPNGLLVKGGYVTLTIDHCSDYVLVNEKVASLKKNTTDTVKSPLTGDYNNIAVLAGILILAGAVLLVMLKKRKTNKA